MAEGAGVDGWVESSFRWRTSPFQLSTIQRKHSRRRGGATRALGWKCASPAFLTTSDSVARCDGRTEWDPWENQITRVIWEPPSAVIPLNATVASRNSAELVGKVAHGAGADSSRPTTARHGAGSGRVRMRWLIVTCAVRSTDLKRLVRRRGVWLAMRNCC